MVVPLSTASHIGNPAYHKQGNYRSRHHWRHMSALQRQAASSLQIDLVNGSSWSKWVLTYACPPAGCFCDARNAPTTTSVRLTAIPSTGMDGCLSASTWVYAGISRGGSWWPTSHTPSLVWTFSHILASWWAAGTIACWTESCRLPWSKQSVHSCQT
jgi:hypothetical protein